MPTPRPIIDTSSGVIVLMSVRPARMKSRRNAVTERRQRERDRDHRRDERAEDDEQHDERREQAEQLLRPLLDGRELGVAVELCRHAGRRDRPPDRILDGEDRFAILVVDDPIELGFRVGDAAVVGDCVLAERISHALQAGLVLGRLELGRLETGDRLLDCRLALRRVEPLAHRRREDEVQDAALLGGELRLDQIRRLLSVGPRDLELVAQLTSDRPDQDDQDGDDAEPAEDDAPRMRRAGPRPARQRAGGQTFVGCAAPIRHRFVNVGRRPTVPVGSSRVLGHACPSFAAGFQYRPPELLELIGR